MRPIRSRLLPVAACLVLALGRAAPAPAVGVPFMVKDIAPGSPHSYPQNLVSLGNRLFFFADDGTLGLEPWVSDGSAAGTFLLRDIAAGSSSSPTNGGVTQVGGIAYFASYDGVSSREIWRSDGTSAGTTLFYDQVVPTGFIRDATRLWCVGAGNGGYQEMIVSDGTYAGTHVATAANAFPTGQNMAEVNGRAFFPASDGSLGVELWSSDGTVAGSGRVADLTPGSGDTQPVELAGVGGLLYFFGGVYGPAQGLCRSDGTEAGTFLLAPLISSLLPEDTHPIVGMNGIAYAIGRDAAHGTELWRSDGTVAGTWRVRDINPGSGDGVTSNGLAVLGNYVYFGATDGVNGAELWRSDGTAAGTQMFLEIFPGAGGSSPQYLTTLDGALFFTAYDWYANTTPWISDGTVAGTQSLGNIRPMNGNQATPSFTYANGYVFFTARDDTHGAELWALAMPAAAGVGPGAPPAVAGLALAQNAPNPCAGAATLRFALPAAGRARLELFDVGGRLVRTIVDDDLAAGDHAETLDTSRLANGLYLYRLQAAGSELEHRLLVVH